MALLYVQYFSVHNILNPMYIQELRKMIPPPIPNTVGVPKHINHPTLLY